MGIKVLLVVEEIEGAEPLGALYIAGCLQRAGHECKFVGTRGNRVEDEVRRFAPRVIATVESRGVHRARSRRRHVHRLRQPREAATHPSAESDHAGDLEPTGSARCRRRCPGRCRSGCVERCADRDRAPRCRRRCQGRSRAASQGHAGSGQLARIARSRMAARRTRQRPARPCQLDHSARRRGAPVSRRARTARCFAPRSRVL